MKIIAMLVALMIPAMAEDWKTTDGKIYQGVKVVKAEPDAVTILDNDGGALVPLANLPADIQKRFNYDPDKAKLAAAKREAQEKEEEELSKPEWQRVSGTLLADWVERVTEETNSASTPLEKIQAQTSQIKLVAWSHILSQNELQNTSNATIKNWVDLTMQSQICEGMPKLLVLMAWGDPGSDTTSTSGDGDDTEVLNYGNFSSVVFLSGGIVKNITQTETVNN